MVRPRRAPRRHHPRAQASDHPLGNLGVLGSPLNVEALEHEVAAASLLVVAAGAVLGHHVVRLVDRLSREERRGRCWSRNGDAGRFGARVARKPHEEEPGEEENRRD